MSRMLLFPTSLMCLGLLARGVRAQPAVGRSLPPFSGFLLSQGGSFKVALLHLSQSTDPSRPCGARGAERDQLRVGAEVYRLADVVRTPIEDDPGFAGTRRPVMRIEGNLVSLRHPLRSWLASPEEETHLEKVGSLKGVLYALEDDPKGLGPWSVTFDGTVRLAEREARLLVSPPPPPPPPRGPRR